MPCLPSAIQNRLLLFIPHNVRRVIRALEMHDDGISYAQQKKSV